MFLVAISPSYFIGLIGLIGPDILFNIKIELSKFSRSNFNYILNGIKMKLLSIFVIVFENSTKQLQAVIFTPKYVIIQAIT